MNRNRRKYRLTNRHANLGAVSDYIKRSEQSMSNPYVSILAASKKRGCVLLESTPNDLTTTSFIVVCTDEQVAKATIKNSLGAFGRVEYRPDGTPGWTLVYVAGVQVATMRNLPVINDATGYML